MALSLDAIFKPLNDFFLKLYQTGAESAVTFRFDKFGSVISEQDFTDPNHPELGYSPNRAQEKFSDLVNHVPSDSGDGMSLVFREDAIDDTYFFRLLSPAQPCVFGSDPNNQNIVDAFSAIKADAVKVWQNLTLESSSGLMLQYKPSVAGPTDWYNMSSPSIWTHQSFSITSPATPSPTPSKWQMWRLKLDEGAMRGVLGPDRIQLSDPVMKALIKAPAAPLSDPVATPQRLKANELASVPMGRSLTTSPLARSATAASALNLRSTGVASVVAGDTVHMDPVLAPVDAQPTFALHDRVRTQFAAVNLSERFQLAQVIGSSAPMQPAATDSIDVSFDYCLVKISRPWYIGSFMADGSWCVPSIPKGSITSGTAANTFSMLPIAFVTIKNLVIEANWAAADMANAAQATDFGPFKVEAGIVQNKLSHPGIQVVGWLLQSLPPLPPNDTPKNDPVAPNPSN